MSSSPSSNANANATANAAANTAPTPPSGQSSSAEPEWRAPATIDDLYARLASSNKWASINSDTAGPRTPGEVPNTGEELQLYALGTPNGQKPAIMLEELRELGVLASPYAAHRIDISKGDQFTEGFTRINPNSKIPALVHRAKAPQSGSSGSAQPIRVFESGAILIYLAELYPEAKLLPAVGDPKRAETLSWLMWQMGGLGPFVGQFGHFWKYCSRTLVNAIDYGVMRYGMETRRLLSVLDKHLADGRVWVVGDEYTVADIAIYPWVVAISNPKGYAAGDFIGLTKGRYPNVSKWVERVAARPAVQRGMKVF